MTKVPSFSGYGKQKKFTEFVKKTENHRISQKMQFLCQKVQNKENTLKKA